jgi:NAD(P)-dependent dehydrogenase (short-subunit alcohol dehydrogenase family)
MIAAPDTGWIPEDEFRGAAILLTGVGHRGQVGEVVAEAFVRRGATVMLVNRDLAAVQERATDLSKHGGVVHAFGCDLTDPAQARDLAIEAAARAAEGLRAVVHLAGGYSPGSPVADIDPATWHQMIAINLTTAFVATQALLPLVRRAHGSMVYFASPAALPGASVSGASAYAIAKGGVATLARAVAAEERENGVRANALAPQAIRTAQNLADMGDNTKYVERETVAAWVTWLCSRAAGPVTGQVIRLG